MLSTKPVRASWRSGRSSRGTLSLCLAREASCFTWSPWKETFSHAWPVDLQLVLPLLLAMWTLGSTEFSWKESLGLVTKEELRWAGLPQKSFFAICLSKPLNIPTQALPKFVLVDSDGDAADFHGSAMGEYVLEQVRYPISNMGE